MRIVGLDIHRVSAEAVMLDEGTIIRLGRVGMTRDHLEAFARRLTHDDHVVVEATGNATAVVEVISPVRGAGRHCQPTSGASDSARQDKDRRDRRDCIGQALRQ